MNSYVLTAQLWKGEYSNFKHKQALIIKSLIENARLGKIFKFNSYGEITFNDDDAETKWHPIVNDLPDFNRNKCNAIIFNINKSEIVGDCQYDKLIIYQDFYNNTKSGYYGMYWYNSESGYSNHIYSIDYLYDNITKHMQDTIHIINNAKTMQFYIDRYKMLDSLINK